MQRSCELEQQAQHLASLVVKAEQLGVLDGWRAYIWHEAKQAGISSDELKRAIERARG